MRGQDDYENRRPRGSEQKPGARPSSRFDNLNPNSSKNSNSSNNSKSKNSRNIPPSLFAAYGEVDDEGRGVTGDKSDNPSDDSFDDDNLYNDTFDGSSTETRSSRKPSRYPGSSSRYGSAGHSGKSRSRNKSDYGNFRGRDDDSGYGPGTGSSKNKRSKLNDDEKKAKTKKIRELVGNQAICLVIIFGLIAAYNWMSADYSGEYIAQDKKLGLVKLSLVRRALTIEGELYYKNTPSMAMQEGKPPKDQQVDLTFVNTNKAAYRPRSINRARFIGTIDGSLAEGAIVDAAGSHNVKLTKNIVASLFKQLQAHIPNFDVPPPPSLFHAPESELQPTPGQTRFAASPGRTADRASSRPAQSQPKPFSMTAPFKGWGGQD